MDLQCPYSISGVENASKVFPYRLSYTGIDFLDYFSCGMVATFQGQLGDRNATEFLNYLFSCFLPTTLIFAIEALRPGVSKAISMPNLFLFVAQSGTAGVLFPIYWAFYIAGGNVENRRNVSLAAVHLDEVVAASFAFVFGSVAPVLGMLQLKSAYAILVWQFFPLYIALLQFAYSKAAPPSKTYKSGFPLIRFLYIVSFILSSSAHITAVWPKITGISWPSAFDLPSSNPSSISTSTVFLLHNFLKWDVVFFVGSFALASLWFARNFKELLGFVLWYVLATPIFGPASAVTGVFIYDEAILSC